MDKKQLTDLLGAFSQAVATDKQLATNRKQELQQVITETKSDMLKKEGLALGTCLHRFRQSVLNLSSLDGVHFSPETQTIWNDITKTMDEEAASAARALHFLPFV